MNADDGRSQQLILDIYDAALNPALWPDVLYKVSEYCGAMGAFFFELEDGPKGQFIVSPHFTSAFDADLVYGYLEEHREREILDQAIFADHSKRGDRIELISDDVLAPDRATLESRPNAQRMRELGVHYRAGALLNKDILFKDRFAMQFSRKQGPLAGDKVVKSSMLLPHIAKAISLGRPASQLAAKYSAVLESLNKLKLGVCIVDGQGRVVLRNNEFDRQTETHDAFGISQSGSLVINKPDAARSVQKMLDSAANHGRFGARPRKEAIIIEPDNCEGALCVEIVPLTSAPQIDSRLRGSSIVFSLDTNSRTEIDAPKLGQLYGLTATEEKILDLVAEGLTNAQIAKTRGKSVETVNTQVKSLLSKTLADNRTQLLRLATQTSSFLTD